MRTNQIDLNGLVGRGQDAGLAQPSPYAWDPPARLPEANSAAAKRPIDFLVPKSRQHEFVLNYLLKRLRWSEQRMAEFYPRWRASEMRLQAYTTVPDYKAQLEAIQNSGEWKAPDTIVVPYAWATQQTISTYMLHTFAGRKPIHQVGAYRGEQVRRAKNMEVLLQYNSDYIKHILQLHKFFQDAETYGVGVFREQWRQEKRQRTVMRRNPQLGAMLAPYGIEAPLERTREEAVSFEGTNVAVINPFMFFPDPRVPMHEVAQRGEFVFWRAFEGRHMLLREEAAGRLKWVRYASATMRDQFSFGNDSAAGLRALGQSLTNGGSWGVGEGMTENFQVDQGTVEIIPAELGLGQGRQPEKWLFTILNKSQIVQAEPLDANHGHHPVSVAEPNYFGNAFGALGTSDLLAPHQDLMSWLVNSHMYNVRATLNNLLVVDPTKVDIDTLINPRPGGLILLKPTPFGSFKPNDAVQQLAIGDATRSHLSDMQLFGRMAADMTGASDNLRGIQDQGGRKSATEVRTSFEAAGSRLAAKARVYSAMAMVVLAEHQASNYQQFLSLDQEFRVLGREGQEASVRINPEEIDGDFFFPIHDGTLPLDRVATLDVWRQVWEGINSDPTGRMQQEYNSPAIFRFMAQLAGAQNIDEFMNGPTPTGRPGQTAIAPDEAIARGVEAGNLVPVPQPGAPLP